MLRAQHGRRRFGVGLPQGPNPLGTSHVRRVESEDSWRELLSHLLVIFLSLRSRNDSLTSPLLSQPRLSHNDTGNLKTGARMSFKKNVWYSIVVLSVAACGSAPTRAPFQGYPFVEVKGITAEEIQSRFSVNCLEGGKVVHSSPYSVTCARPMGDSMGELMYRALLTEKYASNPELMMQSAWTKTSSGMMRVTATAWIEHQNAFGKASRNDLNQDSNKYAIQEALDNFKRNVEKSSPSLKQER